MAALPMKSVPLAPMLNPFQQTVKVVSPLTNMNFPDQTINGRTQISIAAQSQAFTNLGRAGKSEERRMIAVDLNNTEFGAGIRMVDQHDVRGYYVEWIQCQIWLQKFAEPADPNKPLDNWSIVRESPDTSNLTGSFSSSISWGFNASIGAFGDVPTASLGGNLGFSDTHSHTLTDFTFLQHSTARVVDHLVTLTQCADGTAYKNSESLINQWQDPTQGAQLRELPGLAKSNVPVVSMATWMNENDAGLVDKLSVHVAVTPHWDIVEAQNNVFSLSKKTSVLGGTFHYYQDIDFALLK